MIKTHDVAAVRAAREKVFPEYANLSGVVIPFLYSAHPVERNTAVSIVTGADQLQEFAAFSTRPGIAKRFNELKPGALVTFSANNSREVLEIADIQPPQSAWVIAYSVRHGVYQAHNRDAGEIVRLRSADVSPFSPAGDLALGAQVTYHKGADGVPQQVLVQSVPGPVAALRSLQDGTARAAFLYRYYQARQKVVAVGSKLLR